LNENPTHKSNSLEVSMVTRQASFWLAETLKDLDDDQKKIIESYLQGHHIILIGGAGCGKSYVMKRLIRLLYAMYGDEWCKNHVAGVAMTNTIANNMSVLSFEGNEYFF
jgi:predicted ATPase with chaperone activity